MKKTIAGALLGLLAAVLLAELLFRLLPVSGATKTDYYIDPLIATYAPNLFWRYSSGWDLRNPQQMTTNNYGFVSDHAFSRNASAVALIGDSFVEASSLAAPDRMAAQLERALGGQRPVYAMGSAGTALLDYAERVRFAHEVFGIRDFVLVLERGDLRQSLCGSGNATGQCLNPLTRTVHSQLAPSASALRRLLRESALMQYLVSQLKVVPSTLLRQAFVRNAPDAPAAKPEPAKPTGQDAGKGMADVEAVTAAFFERIKSHVAGRLIIVLDADRLALMRHQAIDDPERRHFIELARAAGATVVDTEPVFRGHFEHSVLSLDLGPQDGHFNAIGVRLAVTAAAREFTP